MDINELQNAAIEAATDHIRGQRAENHMAKLKLYCLTAVLCVTIICATIIACVSISSQQETIIEQQYALNMQYAGLLDYINGAEIVTEYADSGDNGTAIIGDGNMLAGGDVNNGNGE